MGSATPLKTTLTENEGSLKFRGDNLLANDRTIYEELIAPLEAKMIRSIWRVARNSELAFRTWLILRLQPDTMQITGSNEGKSRSRCSRRFKGRHGSALWP